MNYTTTWTMSLSDKITAPLNIINEKGKKVGEVFGNSFNTINEKIEVATKKATTFGDCLKKIKPIDWQAVGNSINQISNSLNNVAQVGADFDAGLRDVSAITGITGGELDKLGQKARTLSKDFGGTAVDNLETFKTILSRLGPQIGESQTALSEMGKYANVLSKTMGGDVVGATDALTTSMLQFKVDLNDPIAASKEMERMMNAMAAGAKEGASEVPQISSALVQAGGMAKLANVSFEETNSALQALAQSGKYGAEAGVGLRNVLIKMNAPSALSKEAVAVLEKYGVNMKKVSDSTLPFAERLKELQKIGKSTDALSAVFGAENIQAAQGLIQSAQYQEELTQKITGTNVAYTQSQTVMEGWTEKMKRAKAWIDDLKIGTFDFTSVLSAGFGTMAQGAQITADMFTAYSGLSPVLKSAAVWFKGTAVAQKLVSVWTGIVTVAQWAWNAAMTANPIGIVIVSITALVAVIAVAIKYYDKWGAALLLFLGPVGMVINAFKSIYDHWNSIKNAFQTEGIIGGLKRLGIVLLDVILKPFQQILEVVDKVTGTNWAGKIKTLRDSQNLTTDGEKPNLTRDQKLEIYKRKGLLVQDYDGKWVWPSVKKQHRKEREFKEKGETSVSVDSFINPTPKAKKEKSRSSAKESGLSMSGEKGGNKTINQNVTINNYFSAAKQQAGDMANKIAGAINDRLRDGMVAID